MVIRRACEACERCARRGEQIHHRRPRAAGGSRREDTNSPQNLILLCSPCHSWVESHRQTAYELGFLVRMNFDPATVPIKLGGRWLLLTQDGTYTDAPEPP